MASIQVVEYSDDEEEKRAKAKRKGAKKKQGDGEAPKEKKRCVSHYSLRAVGHIGFEHCFLVAFDVTLLISGEQKNGGNWL